MGKNNQKKEKALRNRENARKFRKKPVGRGRGPGRGGFGGSRPPAAKPEGEAVATAEQPAVEA